MRESQSNGRVTMYHGGVSLNSISIWFSVTLSKVAITSVKNQHTGFHTCLCSLKARRFGRILRFSNSSVTCKSNLSVELQILEFIYIL